MPLIAVCQANEELYKLLYCCVTGSVVAVRPCSNQSLGRQVQLSQPGPLLGGGHHGEQR